MSISQKIAKLEEQRKKLEEQKQLLVNKRKNQIGEFAMRQGLLDTSDELLLGLFAHLSKLIQTNDTEKLNELKKLGAVFRRFSDQP